MPSKADINGWVKALEQTLEVARIEQLDKFAGEVIKKVERHSGELFFFFESGKWAKIGYHSDSWGETEVCLDNEISIFYDVHEFLSGDIVTQHTVETAKKYYEALREIDWEEKDRKDWERLQRKFGKNE